MSPDNPIPSRPGMAAIYVSGTVRARRWHGEGDVRGYRPPSGWRACADLTDTHPITGRALQRAVWWVYETKEKPSSAPAPAFCAGAGEYKNPGAAVATPGVEGQHPIQNAAAFAAAALAH